MKASLITATALGLWVQGTTADMKLNITDSSSIRQTASTLAVESMPYFAVGPYGELPMSYLSNPSLVAGFCATMIAYYHLNNDSTYNMAIMRGLLYQAGPKGPLDLLSSDLTFWQSSNDQGLYALAAMAAVESNFPNPPLMEPQWLGIAKSVLDQFVGRWDTKHCSGGMYLLENNMTELMYKKDSLSNRNFFDLAARLYRYTGNSTYGDWAKKVILWEERVGLITDKFEVYDSIADISDSYPCGRTQGRSQPIFDSALFMHGSATMYNITRDDFWKTRLDGFITRAKSYFTQDGVLYDPMCEPTTWGSCKGIEFYKGLFLHWLAGTAQMAPYTAPHVMSIIRATAPAAVSSFYSQNDSISPATNKDFKGYGDTACGYFWVPDKGGEFYVDAGTMMNVLDAVMYLLLPQAKTPLVSKTGRFSEADPSAEIVAPPNDTNPSKAGGHRNSASKGDLRSAMASIILVSCVISGGFLMVF